MAHTPHSTMGALINDIKLEDTTEYLKFINKVNIDKVDPYRIKDLIDTIPIADFNNLTDNQLELITVLRYRGGDTANFYRYGTSSSAALTKINNIKSNIYRYTIDPSLNKEDLIYMSDYYKSQWTKMNPSRKTTKGTQFTFKMDMFSLILFKNSIKKGFLRTEAKNFVLKVNQAFNTSDKSMTAIKVRNKFYAVILDNTEVHTKAMLNTLQHTQLLGSNKELYSVDPDEALCFSLGSWSGTSALASFNSAHSHDTYASDTSLVTHTNPIDDERVNYRLATMMSILLTMHTRTGNDTYYTLSQRIASKIDKTVLADVINLTTSAANLNKILKESNE